MARLPVKDSTVIILCFILCVTVTIHITGYFALSFDSPNILVQAQPPHKGSQC